MHEPASGPFDSRPPAAAFLTAYCDGGSRGNPGPAGIGVFLEDAEGRAVGEISEFLGIRTNNYAEYSALLAALDFALREGYGRLRVIADSELMVKQIRGQYSVRSPDLKPLYEEARRRIARLQGFEIAHVLRGRNRRADELANAAMDRGMGRGTGRDANRGPDRDIARSIGRAGQQERPGAVSPRGAAALPPEHRRPSPASPRTLRGVVRDGVVHLLEGELPEGALVKIARE